VPYLGNALGVAFSSYKLIDSLTASFNGTTTSFALTVNGVTPVPFPLNEQNILVSVGGVPQKPDSTGTEGFRFSGSNIVFSSAPKTGEAFWGVILAGADRVNAGVSYPDGSASAPSITFSPQNVTGFYRPDLGQIGVSCSGVNTAIFSSAGLTLNGSTSGYTILSAPVAAGSNTLTLPTTGGSANQKLLTDGAGNLSFGSSVVSGTAQASTSGTSIDFTGIPSWVKRVTVMLNGVSTNGTSPVEVRIGSATVSTSGYSSTSSYGGSALQYLTSSTGFTLDTAGTAMAAAVRSGALVLTLIGSNTWVGTGSVTETGQSCSFSGNSPALSGTLDRVRLTTVNGTDAFDAGSVNILYE
jgi:hypothetical protein